VKKRIITYLFGLFLFGPVIGFCEEYLQLTDILPKGHFDMTTGIFHSEFSNKAGTDIFGSPTRGREFRKQTTEFVDVRYGLGLDSQMGVEIPYSSQREYKYKTFPGSFLMSPGKPQDSDGIENLEFFFRHRFLGGGDSRFSLAGHVGLDANTADRKYTSLSLGVSAGWAFDSSSKGYVRYLHIFTDQDSTSDGDELSASLYKKITPTITLIPTYSYTHYEAARVGSFTLATPRDVQSIGISAQLKILPRSYLIPYIGFDFHEGYTDDLPFKRQSSNDGKTFGLSFYHAFEPIR
jgi:hypothetical protein